MGAEEAGARSRSRVDWLPWCLIALSHLPLGALHLRHLAQSGLHGHFPFVLAASAWGLYQAWEQEAKGRRRARRAGSWAVLTAGLLLLLLAALVWSPWLGYVAALATGFGGLLQWHPAPVRDWFGAWLLLWLLVPLPMGLDAQLALDLQGVSARAASTLLDFFRVSHLRTGNVIEIPGVRYSVEEACSGIHSLFAMVATAAIWGVLQGRSLVHVTLLVASAGVWSVVGNMARIAGVVVIGSAGWDLTVGWRHQAYGVLNFVVVFLLVLSTDRLWRVLLEPAEDPLASAERDAANETGRVTLTRTARSEEPIEKSADDSGGEVAVGEVTDAEANVRRRAAQQLRAERTRPLSRVGLWTFAVLFAAAGILAVVAKRGAAPLLPSAASPPISIAKLRAETLPGEVAGWQRVGFATEHRGANNSQGEYSAVWRYRRGQREAVVALDFPFTDWHTLTACYRGQGCAVRRWRVLRTAADAAPGESVLVAVAELSRAEGDGADLIFVEWTAGGELLVPPATERPSWQRLMTDVLSRFAGLRGVAVAEGCVYQLQVFSPSVRSTTDEAGFQPPLELLTASLKVLRPITTASGRGGL